MQNRSAAGSLALGQRVRQTVRAHKLGAAFAAYGAGGFLSANAFVLGGLAPFGVSFAAAAPDKYAPAAILGAALGYLISYQVFSNIKYVIAMLLLFLLRWGFTSSSYLRLMKMPGQVSCAISLGLPLMAFTVVSGGNVYGILLNVSEVLLACCAAYFFIRTAQTFEKGLENARQTDLTSMVIAFAIAVLALVHLKVFGLSLGRMLAVLVVLVAAQAAKEAGGAIAGVTAGVAAGILAGSNAFLMGTYGFGGLLAGVFAHLSRAAAAGVFLMVNLFALIADRSTMDPYLLVEIFISSVISILIPLSTLERLLGRGQEGTLVAGETYKAMLTNQMGDMSGALREVADATRQVNDKLAGMVGGDISSVYQCAADRVCRKCRQNATCWQLHYNDTNDALSQALGALRRGEPLEESAFPDWFAHSCKRLPELCKQMAALFSEYMARETVKRKMGQVRGVITDQFEGMALMIDAMGKDLDKIQVQDNETAQKVRQYLQTLTIFPDRVCCTLDGETNMTLEMVVPAYKLGRLRMEELTLDLSDLCGREFDLPARERPNDGNLIRLTFQEKATYSIRWGASQSCNGGARVCGDSYSYVDGKNGRVNVILSDGMGSGGAAAVDSTMTSQLLKKLIQAGVGLDAALKLVNSALLVKTGEESLATIDITGIDLYTGRVEFYKAGAAPTFLRKSGKGGYVQTNSLPVGILGGVSFEKSAVTLREGDWIVMVSDGAIAGSYDWLVSELEHYEGQDPQEFSERLLREARRRRDDGHEDDITVIAILLEEGV